MDRKIVDIMFALLNQEMGFKTFSEDFVVDIKDEYLKPLYLLAKKHDLAHIIGNALEKLGVVDEITEGKKRFVLERNLAVFRTETLMAELEVLCAELSKNKIDHIPLKGSVIRKLYPEPWMRTSCDIDVLVHENDIERAENLLCEKLGYTSKGERDYHDISMYSDTGVHLELHFNIKENIRT